MTKRKIMPGDTWVAENPVTGRQGVVYLKDIYKLHPRGARFEIQTWEWYSWYSDGSGQEFDWQTTYARAVDDFKTSLGSGADKVRMRFAPDYKYGEKTS